MPSLLFRDHLARFGTERAYLIGLLTVQTEPLPLRLASERDRNVQSRGLQFFRSGFDFQVPPRPEEGASRVQLVLPVVDRTILAAIRAHPTRFALSLEVTTSRDPDTVELGPYLLYDVGRSFEAQTQSLTVECVFRDVLAHPRPRLRYSPGAVPGMFGRPNLQGVET